jgi:hypothetical protein
MALALLLVAISASNRIETRRGTITTTSKDSVIGYVQSHVAPGQEILVYPYLPLYNYLTATRSPSAHDYFQPGMNTKQQADEIILSLKSHPARSILFEPWFASKFSSSWPRTPLSAIAYDSVGDFIVQNYQVCAILQSPAGWQFEYLVRKTAPVNEQYSPRNEPSQISCE